MPQWRTVGILIAFFLGTGAPAAWGENSCVACHQRPETIRTMPTWSQDLFVHWYGSVHGEKGVTCDKCHRLAPTCTTCHGFRMDIGAVTPVQLMGRCTICHAVELGVKPEVVDLTRGIVEEIARTERLVQRSEAMAALAREEGRESKEAEGSLKTARDRLKKSQELWHRFQPEVFQRELADIQTVAREAYVSARRAILEEKK